MAAVRAHRVGWAVTSDLQVVRIEVGGPIDVLGLVVHLVMTGPRALAALASEFYRRLARIEPRDRTELRRILLALLELAQ